MTHLINLALSRSDVNRIIDKLETLSYESYESWPSLTCSYGFIYIPDDPADDAQYIKEISWACDQDAELELKEVRALRELVDRLREQLKKEESE